MNPRTAFLLLAFTLLALFTALNWSAFMHPTTLSLAVAEVEAPLGVILLGFIVLLSALFLLFVTWLQGSVLLESRRMTRELQAQRELADKAEASRFSSLQEELKRGMLGLHERIDRLDHDLGAALERNEASTAAYVGELGDRVDRIAPGTNGTARP